MFEFNWELTVLKVICLAFLIFYTILSLSGCTSFHLTAPDGTVVDRVSLFSDVGVGRLEGTKWSDGSVKFTLQGYRSEQIESAKAIAQGVTEGLAAGAAKAIVP